MDSVTRMDSEPSAEKMNHELSALLPAAVHRLDFKWCHPNRFDLKELESNLKVD